MRFGESGAEEAPARLSGKHVRRGGPSLPPDAVLAHLSTAGGRTYAVRAGVRGTLLEVNERLLREPSALRDAPSGAGYIAIVKPVYEQALAELRRRALARDEFVRAVAARAAANAAASLP